LWYLNIQIERVKIRINEDEFLLINENTKGAFENSLLYKKQIFDIYMIEINNIDVNIPLEIIKNTSAVVYKDFNFLYNKDENKFTVSTLCEFQGSVSIWNENKTDLIYSTSAYFDNSRVWLIPTRNLYNINNIRIEIKDMNDNLIKEEYMTLKNN
jgi:hypothetical protein